MKTNTRFNPSTSGSLTIGNLYTALVNATEAHKIEGSFILRVDDNQPAWIKRLGQKEIERLSFDYFEELSRFMVIDKFERQSKLPKLTDLMYADEILKFIPKIRFEYDDMPEWIIHPDTEMYPYAPMLTIEKVAWDYMEGVRWLIRGDDLISEANLYSFFVDVLGVPRVRQTYIPRLRTQEKGELFNVSKSFATYKIRHQIDRFGVDGTLELLKQSCLVNPEGEFTIENIKCNPTIVGFDQF
jgi:glutamyl/glutaminyl-tRNA synthetase